MNPELGDMLVQELESLETIVHRIGRLEAMLQERNLMLEEGMLALDPGQAELIRMFGLYLTLIRLENRLQHHLLRGELRELLGEAQ
ncbi:MAG: hypothetical protein HY319_21235 [Armatimonadetes bacterium]|nr:hypothetical protein [Armatimonadota bacterium]